MTRWQCPKCDEHIDARCSGASHRCPADRTRVVEFVKVEEEERADV